MGAGTGASGLKILREGFIPVLLAVSIIAVYWQVREFEFISFDDYMYIRDNPHIRQGLTFENIKWAFTALYAANWHPLTWLSHMADAEFFGLNPGMHHFTNVVLHVLNTLLLFYFFRKTTGAVWKSAAVAALFALHPLHVESVAWVAERKDVLSTLFWMLTMVGYAWYVRQRTPGRYILVASCYVLGLMSKPMLVTLPLILLLLDFWPLERPEIVKPRDRTAPGRMPGIRLSGLPVLVLEKVPLLVLAAGASVSTIIAQKGGGAMSTFDLIPLHIRIENAITSYVAYLAKAAWPIDLAVFYPYPGSFSLFAVIGSLLLLTAATTGALYVAGKFPFLLTGWLWYLGTLFPVIGIVQVGSQSMADRYTYIPLVGIFILAVWGLERMFDRRKWGIRMLTGISCSAIALLMWSAWLQTGYWKDNITLFSHAAEVVERNFLAHNSLGAAFFDQGNIDAALHHYREALRINPRYTNAHNNLGAALASQGKYEDAITHYRTALEIDPSYTGAHYNIGLALSATGRADEAAQEYVNALKLDPGHAKAHNNLGIELESRGEYEDAIRHYREALLTEPGFLRARLNLAATLNRQERYEEAAQTIKKGLQEEPENAVLCLMLARVLAKKGDRDNAVSAYRNLLSREPSHPHALGDLAVLYAGEQDYDAALAVLERLAAIQPDNPDVFYNIACIYARQGRNDASVHWLKLSIEKGFDDWDLIKKDPDLTCIKSTPYVQGILEGR